jgi:uncharacterized protein YacL
MTKKIVCGIGFIVGVLIGLMILSDVNTSNITILPREFVAIVAAAAIPTVLAYIWIDEK